MKQERRKERDPRQWRDEGSLVLGFPKALLSLPLLSPSHTAAEQQQNLFLTLFLQLRVAIGPISDEEGEGTDNFGKDILLSA